MKTDDIAGAKPRSYMETAFKRDTLNIRDIEGTSAHQRTLIRKNSLGYESFEYKDVTKPNWMTSRRGDPQNPQYLVFDEDGKSYKIGEVEGSKPTPAPSPPK